MQWGAPPVGRRCTVVARFRRRPARVARLVDYRRTALLLRSYLPASQDGPWSLEAERGGDSPKRIAAPASGRTAPRGGCTLSKLARGRPSDLATDNG
jgi:hypothetical protein